MLVIFLRYVLERLVLSACDEIKICKKRKLNLQRMSPTPSKEKAVSGLNKR